MLSGVCSAELDRVPGDHVCDLNCPRFEKKQNEPFFCANDECSHDLLSNIWIWTACPKILDRRRTCRNCRHVICPYCLVSAQFKCRYCLEIFEQKQRIYTLCLCMKRNGVFHKDIARLLAGLIILVKPFYKTDLFKDLNMRLLIRPDASLKFYKE